MDRSLVPEPLLGSGPAQDRIRDPRTSRLFVGQFVLEDGKLTKVRIRNLSEGGFGGRSDMVLQLGQRGHMLLAGVGLITGRVAWVRENDFGLQFDTRINPEQARISAPANPVQSDYVVPPQFRPVIDHRRPGFKIR